MSYYRLNSYPGDLCLTILTVWTTRYTGKADFPCMHNICQALRNLQAIAESTPQPPAELFMRHVATNASNAIFAFGFGGIHYLTVVDMANAALAKLMLLRTLAEPRRRPRPISR